MLGHAAGLLLLLGQRSLRQFLGGVGGFLLVARLSVEVGDVVLFEAQRFYTFAGREFRWGGGLAGREFWRGVVGH